MQDEKLLQEMTGMSSLLEGLYDYDLYWDFPGGSDGKEPAHQCRKPGFNPWVGKIPWRKEWVSTPVFLPGESHRQRSLVGYSPWGWKEMYTTELLSTFITVIINDYLSC